MNTEGVKKPMLQAPFYGNWISLIQCQNKGEEEHMKIVN